MTAKELMDILNSDDYVEEGPYTHKTLQRIIDAAEYLPAQPEHCSGCLHPDGHNGETHCYGTIEHPDQSAPVEPTRGNACPGCGDSESGCDQAGCWKTGILYAAEPKPQPDSSPISSERCPYCMETKDGCFDNEYCASTHWPKTISTEHHIVDAHEMVDLIDKTLSCTSGLSFGDCLEEIKRRLGAKDGRTNG